MNALVGFQGKVQEEELDFCRAAPASGADSGMREQGEKPTWVLPLPFLRQYK
jgi:hypothetical protein